MAAGTLSLCHAVTRQTVLRDLSKGSFTLRDETMCCRTHDSLITFNINGLGPLKTKSGGRGIPGYGRVGGCVGWRFCLEGS